ncbi:MAG: hypothetical protein O7D34_10940, partial [Ignavibacteria bacterium]|nr:hypothetical protein [Ignavibacteria bacterium]
MRRGRLPRFCGLFLFILSLSVAHSAGRSGRPVPFSVLRQDPDGWTVEYTHRPVPFTTVEIDGSRYMV